MTIEVDTLKDHNVLLITMHREGCNFSNDSREYVEAPRGAGWDSWGVYNNGSVEQLKTNVEDIVAKWLK